MYDQVEFETLLEDVRNHLIHAQLSFDVWNNLRPTEENDTLDILNAFKGFFKPVMGALQDRFIIHISNTLDAKQKKAPSFYRLLKMLMENMELAPGLDVEALRTRIEEQKPIERKIRVLRNKGAAHWEIGAKLPNVLISDVGGLLQELEACYNEIFSSAHPKEYYAFGILEIKDTENLVQSLKRYHSIVSPATFVAWGALPDKRDPSQYVISADLVDKLREELSGQ